MIKSILVAVDDSLTSYSALDVAANLAALTSAKLKGLYVEDVMRLVEWQPAELIGAGLGLSSAVPSSRPTAEQLEIEKEFEKEGSGLKKLFTDSAKNIHFKGSFQVIRSKVDETIIEASKTVNLVVIGRRGKSYPLDSIEPGPVTENLLRHTTRPVLVVPAGGKLSNRILIAYDGSETSQRALTAGAQFAEILPSVIKVVCAGDDKHSSEKPLNEAREFLLAYNLNVNYVTESGSNKPWKGIIEQAKAFDAGIIVIGAFGSNRIMEMIFGSTTREVLMQSTCPVLLCR